MKHRALAAFCLLFAAGDAAALVSGVEIPIPALFTVLLLCVLGRQFFPRQAVLAVAVAGAVCGFAYTQTYVALAERPAASLDGELERIEVTVRDYPEQYEDSQRVSVTVPAQEFHTPTRFRTLLTLPLTEQSLEPGDRVSVFVEFSAADMSEGFDRESYYRSLGVPILAKQVAMTEIVVAKAAYHPLWYYPKALREKFYANLSTLFDGRSADFLSALLLGKRRDFAAIDYNHLVKAGLAHVAAISGLHVGFLIALLVLLFGRKWASILGIPMLCFYVLMVGATPSVLRASVMAGMILVAFLRRRERESMDFLCYALFVVLVLCPSSLLSVGLQLSFASTLSILLFAERMTKALKPNRKRISRLLLKLWDGAAATLSCSVCTLLTCPILLFHFGYLSVFAPFANLLALWAVMLVFPLGLAVCLFSLLSMKLAAVFAVPVGLLVRWVWIVADGFSAIKSGLLYGEDLRTAVVICVIAALCAAGFLSRRRVLLLGTAAALLTAMVGYSLWDGAHTRQSLRITCLPEGAAQCLVISRGERTMLIDCGTSGYHDPTEDVREYLDWWNYDGIDTLVLTAYNQTHAGALEEIAKQIPISEVWCAEGSSNDAQSYRETLERQFSGEHLHTLAGRAEQRISEQPAVSACELDEHLAVSIETDGKPVRIVHSLTQNRLLRVCDGRPQDCSALICSESLFDDDAKKETLLSLLSPERIVLENGWSETADAGGIPVYFVKKQGSLTISCP